MLLSTKSVRTFLFSLAVVCLISAIPPVPQDVLARRRQAISQLNELQRQELLRKYDAYRHLSLDEQNRLRTLHQNLEAEPPLKEIMQRYCEWLKDLDINQREQLRQAATPAQKRGLVVKFHQEQTRKKTDLWRELGVFLPPDRRMLPPLSSEELKSVMTALEGDLAKKGVISSERQVELENLRGTQRYKLLMKAIAEFRHPTEGGAPRKFTLQESDINVVVKSVDNTSLQEKLKLALRNPEQRQHPVQKVLFFVLLTNTVEEACREITGPDATSLKESIFRSLTPEEQARFSQQAPWTHDRLLLTKYVEEIRQTFMEAGDLPPRPLDGRPPRAFFPAKEGGPGNGRLSRPGDGPRTEGHRSPPGD